MSVCETDDMGSNPILQTKRRGSSVGRAVYIRPRVDSVIWLILFLSLDTHGVGNKVKKIYDSEKDEYRSEKTHKKCICGKVILKGSRMCLSCNGKDKRKVNRPIYEDLVKLVNEVGNTKAGKEYGVTEACIRKWIKNKW